MATRTSSLPSKPASMGGLPTFTAIDYSKFFGAGALCCLASHGGMTPIDVVKTRIQVDPELAGTGMVTAARRIIAAEGTAGLLTGFGPTATGYFVQGGLKFAGYEYWKKTLIQWSGGPEAALPHRTAIYIVGASIAEFFADIALAPLEATRIRLVSDRTYAKGFLPAFTRMAREGGMREFYAGFTPLLAKQIPYAVGQFTVNEWAHEVVYKTMSEEQKANLSPLTNGAITLGCGLTAGAAAAVLSHPADTLLSKINRGAGGKGSATSKLIVLAKEAGPRGLFVGLGPRIIMTMGLVSSQFVLYKYIKDALSAPPGVELHKQA